MIDHVAVQVADVDDSVSFYTEVFGPIGIEELMRFGTTVGLGRDGFPHLWFSPAGGAETRELHLALAARSRAEVDGVHAAALARGARCCMPRDCSPNTTPATTASSSGTSTATTPKRCSMTGRYPGPARPEPTGTPAPSGRAGTCQ